LQLPIVITYINRGCRHAHGKRSKARQLAPDAENRDHATHAAPIPGLSHDRLAGLEEGGLLHNRNAGYYTVADVPRFDDWGLWAYRDIRFSRAGTLLDTLVALVSQASAGLTVGELKERLQTPVSNLLSRLVRRGQLHREVLRGREVVYVSPDKERAHQQWERRQEELRTVAAKTERGLPAGCPAPLVIDVLRQMILTPDDGPEQWARQLQTQGRQVTAGQIHRVRKHYALKKKRQS
jgi:hypothetical protein